jgi:hypothetical protein
MQPPKSVIRKLAGQHNKFELAVLVSIGITLHPALLLPVLALSIVGFLAHIGLVRFAMRRMQLKNVKIRGKLMGAELDVTLQGQPCDNPTDGRPPADQVSGTPAILVAERTPVLPPPEP